jgi:hypothetical protein
MENAYKPDNENEPLIFTKIGLAAALVMNRLRCELQILDADKKQNPERPGDTNAGRTEEEKEKEQREYVDHRLRELAAFERKAAGK